MNGAALKPKTGKTCVRKIGNLKIGNLEMSENVKT